MLNKNVMTFIGCDCEYEDAKIVLFGAPFDSTTSYRPGTRFASQVMRNDSWGLETYSPYQDKDMTDYGYYFDSGDLELPIGDSVQVLDAIEKRTETILNDGKLPFMIGGEHLVTLGSFRAVAKKIPDVHIIHFDAHTDLREDYLGVTLSHASVIRRCHDIVGDGKIFQFGIRSGDRPEFLWAKEGYVSLNKFNFNGLKETVEKLKGKPVYFTIDLDVLDPSVFPGTGTPEAGGVQFMELLDAIHTVIANCNIVGCDVNELCPPLDTSGASTAVACKVVREMLLELSK
ncbi:agmatinase [Lachnoclostridium sp. An181]|uniref:agmatinase n=1 Tax=Lachnoclostridium sp. An181 TaxID=1965575 RepID=UPI000B3ADD5D|nr:agmatinase [Lachnoclostridium sp. An181]OUP49048.1 agmatinase [Lachnoclostridium sp. An181]